MSGTQSIAFPNCGSAPLISDYDVHKTQYHGDISETRRPSLTGSHVISCSSLQSFFRQWSPIRGKSGVRYEIAAKVTHFRTCVTLQERHSTDSRVCRQIIGDWKSTPMSFFPMPSYHGRFQDPAHGSWYKSSKEQEVPIRSAGRSHPLSYDHHRTQHIVHPRS